MYNVEADDAERGPRVPGDTAGMRICGICVNASTRGEHER
jgi:hypothetical protein